MKIILTLLYSLSNALNLLLFFYFKNFFDARQCKESIVAIQHTYKLLCLLDHISTNKNKCVLFKIIEIKKKHYLRAWSIIN